MFDSFCDAAIFWIGCFFVPSVGIWLLMQIILFAFGSPNGNKYIQVKRAALVNTPPSPDQFASKRDPLPRVTIEAFTPRKVDANGMEQIDQAQIDAIKAKIEAQKSIPTYQAEFEILD